MTMNDNVFNPCASYINKKKLYHQNESFSFHHDGFAAMTHTHIQPYFSS